MNSLIGRQFARWTVVDGPLDVASKNSKWLCKCECGTTKAVFRSGLINGDSKSCGCLSKELLSARKGKRKRHTKQPVDFRIESDHAVLILRDVRRQPIGEALIDIDDLEKVIALGRFQMVPSRKTCYAKHKSALLHRLILGVPRSAEVDHINHNGLDCRRFNLRVATKSENGQNLSGPHCDSKSGFRNVYWNATQQNWYVQICINRKRISLGSFTDVTEAAKVASEGRAMYQPCSPENSMHLNGASL